VLSHEECNAIRKMLMFEAKDMYREALAIAKQWEAMATMPPGDGEEDDPEWPSFCTSHPGRLRRHADQLTTHIAQMEFELAMES
jgi:hypothetical protein